MNWLASYRFQENEQNHWRKIEVYLLTLTLTHIYHLSDSNDLIFQLNAVCKTYTAYILYSLIKRCCDFVSLLPISLNRPLLSKTFVFNRIKISIFIVSISNIFLVYFRRLLRLYTDPIIKINDNLAHFCLNVLLSKWGFYSKYWIYYFEFNSNLHHYSYWLYIARFRADFKYFVTIWIIIYVVEVFRENNYCRLRMLCI